MRGWDRAIVVIHQTKMRRVKVIARFKEAVKVMGLRALMVLRRLGRGRLR